MKISIIAAVNHDNVIGVDDKIPWSIPFDMKIFREHTLGKTVVMGRKTFESMGSKCLPERHNIVLTSSKDRRPYASKENHTAMTRQTLYDALQSAQNIADDVSIEGGSECVIIGGESVYRAALPIADEVFLTLVATSSPYIEKSRAALFPVKEMSGFNLKVVNPFYQKGAHCLFTKWVRLDEKFDGIKKECPDLLRSLHVEGTRRCMEELLETKHWRYVEDCRRWILQANTYGTTS